VDQATWFEIRTIGTALGFVGIIATYFAPASDQALDSISAEGHRLTLKSQKGRLLTLDLADLESISFNYWAPGFPNLIAMTLLFAKRAAPVTITNNAPGFAEALRTLAVEVTPDIQGEYDEFSKRKKHTEIRTFRRAEKLWDEKAPGQRLQLFHPKFMNGKM